MEYKAKETFYNGIIFRSKNEAKWARFFDLLNIEYAYEPVTVIGWNSTRYKPDFYFPEYDRFAEVKSSVSGIHNDTMAEKLNGAIDYQATSVSNGLILLGAFPYDVRVQEVRLITKWLFWNKGVCCANAYIQQVTGSQFGNIFFSKHRLDCGDPLPETASPDIYVDPFTPGRYMTIAINDTNEFFTEGN